MRGVTFGPFRFDLDSRELWRSGVAIKLQPQPSKLLVLLVERSGAVITRDEIRREMWGANTFVDFDQSVNFCVRQIRAALYDTADRPLYIETLPRQGYRFIAPVQRVPDQVAAPAAARAVSPPPRRLSWSGLALTSFFLVILVGVTGTGGFKHAPSPERPDTNPRLRHEVELGLFFLNKLRASDTLVAIEHFEAAVRDNPHYAPAYAGLADAYNQLGSVFIGAAPPANVRMLALRAATRAIQLDPTLAQAYAALGYTSFHEFDWSQADWALRRAIELDPRYTRAHQNYAGYLAARRRFGEAINEARRALDLEPASLRARMILAWMLYFDRQYDAAIRELRMVLQMEPSYAMAHFRLGQVLVVAGRLTEAIAPLKAAVDGTQRAPAALGLLAMAYGGSGQRSEAASIVDELEQRSASENVPTGAVLLAYIGIGDKDRAIDALERGYAERDNYEVNIDADPLMDPLRDQPRFHAICRRVLQGTQPPWEQTSPTVGDRH